jgi:hypothetical protein
LGVKIKKYFGPSVTNSTNGIKNIKTQLGNADDVEQEIANII